MLLMIQTKKLEAWFEERPKWLQDAARRLALNGIISDQDYTDLFSICISEASKQNIPFTGLPSGAFNVQDKTKSLHLDSISDIQGINALCPSKPLEFGNSPLCIVYGFNGTGKSGYVWLLKHACGARRPGELLDNIFKPGAQPQVAKITFTEDMKTKSPTWAGEPLPELSGVDIYDTVCGLVYINEENEVTFEPWLLRLFTQLTEASESLKQLIQTEIDILVSKKPSLPEEYSTTTSAKWYGKITASITVGEVDSKTEWKAEHETELNEITKRLGETNPASKATELRRHKVSLVGLVNELKKQVKVLNDNKCLAYVDTKADLKIKRMAADRDAKKVFENAPLAGIGSDSWKLLWEAARKYSTEHAYATTTFPNISEDARCVLCQRELDQKSRERFSSFNKFIEGELQSQASDADKKLQQLTDSLSEFVTDKDIAIRIDSAGIIDDGMRNLIKTFVSSLAERKNTLIAAENFNDISKLPQERAFDFPHSDCAVTGKTIPYL